MTSLIVVGCLLADTPLPTATKMGCVIVAHVPYAVLLVWQHPAWTCNRVAIVSRCISQGADMCYGYSRLVVNRATMVLFFKRIICVPNHSCVCDCVSPTEIVIVHSNYHHIYIRYRSRLGTISQTMVRLCVSRREWIMHLDMPIAYSVKDGKNIQQCWLFGAMCILFTLVWPYTRQHCHLSRASASDAAYSRLLET